MKIADVMATLELSHAAATRAFKQALGLSPKSYLNKMRSFQAAFYLLLENQAVYKTGALVGYTDISRFQKQFKKYFGGAPSQYRFRTPPTQVRAPKEGHD